MNESFWLSSTPKTDYPTLVEDLKVDVAIIGGGMAGITAAYLLGEEGLKVAVLEADRILMGTTAHTTAKLTSQHGLIYDQIKRQVGAEQDVERISGEIPLRISCFATYYCKR